MFATLKSERPVLATSRAARLGSAAAAVAIGSVLLVAKLGLSAHYQHELALAASTVVLPTVEVVAQRPQPMVVAGALRAVN